MEEGSADRGQPEGGRRYCASCGEIFAATTAVCPNCRARWRPASPASEVARLAFLLEELVALDATGALEPEPARRLRDAYEARLLAARPPRRARPAPVSRPATAAAAIPPRPTTAAIPPRPAGPARPATAAIPPRPPRPAKPPGPGFGDWMAKRQADLLLYLGAFLMSVAAIIFVGYGGEAVNDPARVVILGGYTVFFLVFGVLIRRWARIREAGPVFVGLGAVLTPLNFVLLYTRILHDRDVPQEWVWLGGSSATTGLYGLLAFRGFGRLYVIPAGIAALIAWGSLAATLAFGIEWYGAWYMLPAAAINLAGAVRPRRWHKWLELLAAAIAVPALAWSHGAAFFVDTDLGRVELPVTYGLALIGVAASVRSPRSGVSRTLLPALFALTGDSAVWAATGAQGSWAFAWLFVVAAGYLVVAHFAGTRASAWALVATAFALAGGLAAYGLVAGGEETARLPAAYAAALSLAAVAWLRWRWVASLALLPALAAGAAGTAAWSFLDVPVEWVSAAFAAAGLGYVAIAWLEAEHQELWHGLTLLSGAVALSASHIAVAQPDTVHWQLPVAYGLCTVGATAAYVRYRWVDMLAALPPLTAATVATLAWVAFDVPFEWLSVAIAAAGLGYLAIAWFERSEEGLWHMLAGAFGGVSVMVAHSGAGAPDTNLWQLPVTYAMTTAGAATGYWRHRWLDFLVALPPLAAATAATFAWVAFDVPFEWLSVAIAAAGLGYVAVAWFETEHREIWHGLTVFSGAVALSASHIAVTQPDTVHWQLPVAYGLCTVGATAAYVRCRRVDMLAALPPLAAATVATFAWVAFDVPFEWLSVAIAAAGLGYLVIAWFERAHEKFWHMLAGASGAGAVVVGHLGAATPDTNLWQLPFAYAICTTGAVAGYWRHRWFDFLVALPPLAAATAATFAWAAFDVPFEWTGTAVAAAALGYLAVGWFERDHASLWRQLAAMAAIAGLAAAHYAAPLPDTNAWQLPVVYGEVLLGALWQAIVRRDDPAWLLVPALGAMGASTLIWASGAPVEHRAWPAVAAALLIAVSDRFWAKRPALEKAGWPYALAASLVPLGFIPIYAHAEAAGAGCFALAALVWLVAAIRAGGAFSRLVVGPGERPAPVMERQGLVAGSLALGFVAAAYANAALELSPAEGAWTFAVIAAVAWLGIAAFGRLVPLLIPILGIAALVATFISVAAGLSTSADESARITLMMGVSTITCALSLLGSRRWYAALPIAAGVVTTAAFGWHSQDWPLWSLAMVYAAGALIVAAALTPLRDYKDSERSMTVSVLSTVPAAVALFTIYTALQQRADALPRGETLASTSEWRALVVILAAFGSAIVTEGLRLNLRVLTIAGTAVVMLAIELGIATRDPANVQWYTTPMGVYLVLLGMSFRQSEEFFGAHMRLHEAVVTAGAALIVVPGARQSFEPGGAYWGLVLIGEGLALLAVGLVLSQRWLVVAAVLTLGGVGFRFFTASETRPPFWLTLGLVGLLLLGVGVVLLLAREWWDRTKARLADWWIHPHGPWGGAGMAPGG